MSRVHYRLEDTRECLILRMPAHKQWFAMVVVAVLLFGFLYFFVDNVAYSIAKQWHASSFGLIVSLVVYALLFLALLTWSVDLYWQLKGQEVVEISAGSIAIHHQAGSLKVSRSCKPGQIEAVRLTARKVDCKPGFFRTQDFLFWSYRFGRLEVAYRTGDKGVIKHYRFGSALNDAEARKLVGVIQERLGKSKL